ncbi:hypothetical protein B566_EDAN017066, partial [Ephemera danica]
MGSQCTYVWDSGEPMTYTNWNTGNPARQTTEECMTWYGGKWSVYPCSANRWFICEEVDVTTTSTTTTSSTTTTTTSTTTTITTSIITTTTPCPIACKTSSCLASSWYDSLAFCMKYGMTLASLETQAETDAVNSYIKSQGTLLTVFISGNKIGGQCNYGWESGEPMTYTNWLPGNPAEALTEECMVWYDSKWGDLP